MHLLQDLLEHRLGLWVACQDAEAFWVPLADVVTHAKARGQAPVNHPKNARPIRLGQDKRVELRAEVAAAAAAGNGHVAHTTAQRAGCRACYRVAAAGAAAVTAAQSRRGGGTPHSHDAHLFPNLSDLRAQHTQRRSLRWGHRALEIQGPRLAEVVQVGKAKVDHVRGPWDLGRRGVGGSGGGAGVLIRDDALASVRNCEQVKLVKHMWRRRRRRHVVEGVKWRRLASECRCLVRVSVGRRMEGEGVRGGNGDDDNNDEPPSAIRTSARSTYVWTAVVLLSRAVDCA